MQKRVFPSTTTPARYVFDLTREELEQALVSFVEQQGESVPPGRKFVWGLEAGMHYPICVSLAIEENEARR